MAVHCVITNLRVTFPAITHSPQNTASLRLTQSQTENILTHHYTTQIQNIQRARSFAARALSSPKRSSLNVRLRLWSTVSPPRLRTMASDSDYMDFLNKANQQRDAGIDKPQAESTAPSSQQVRTRTVETSAKVPDVLKTVDSFYISETDEPFEPVALEWEGASRGKWPTPDQFASLITTSKSAASDISQSIETLPPSSFDPRDQYSSVIGTVREAAAASDPNVDESEIDVKVYRVEVGHSRVEYWVVALSATNGNIVGFRAKAVES